MNRNFKAVLFAGVATASLLASTATLAQDTSAAMRGTVATETGASVSNATIKVTHVASGSTRTFTSSADGNFQGRGLRVGGPYTVVVSSDQGEVTYENVFLRLGESFNLNAVLESTSSGVEEILVTGTKSAAFRKTGPGSFFGEDDINGAQGLDRDLKDILRRNPLINIMSNDSSEMTVAGVNPKYNSLTIDGVSQNDDFGLNTSGYPTQRSPVSLDAIAQMSVAIAPYTVTTGGFTGAQVNVVTKSGTNDFHGTAFYEFSNNHWAGNETQDDDIRGIEFDRKFYGATLGGPIVKDKLFFFASYEKYSAPQSFTYGPAGSGAANETEASIDDVNEAIRIARDVYGYDAGSWNDPIPLVNEQIMAKLDWNIADGHRASFTYQKADGNRTGNMTDDEDELRLSSHWYNRADKMEMYVGQLYSDWTDNFSTELKVGKKTVDNTQSPLKGTVVGEINIDAASGEIALGADRSRHANQLNNDSFVAMLKGVYTKGDHEITGGWEYNTIDAYNVFVQDALGQWNFDSLADFEARIASDFVYQNAVTNNSVDAGADFKFKYNTFYLEDRWTASNDLTFTGGVRYETINTDDSPTENTLFGQRYGFSNTNTLNGKNILLPRLGFNWTPTDRLTVRGGVGKFSGGKPNVWISNAYSNDGVTIVNPNPDLYDEAAILANADITTIPASVLAAMEPGNGNTTPIDPNFKLPYDWKWSLAADYVANLGPLGDDWKITVEALFSKSNVGVAWRDLGRVQVGTDSTGRPIYAPDDPLDDHTPTNPFDDNGVNRHDIMLTNGPGGNSQVFSIDFFKDFNNGVKFGIGYAHQDVNEAVAGTSSTAGSNFQYDPHLDRQNPQIGTAPYEIKNRITWSLSYEKDLFIKDHKTKFSFFGDHHSGRPYSWVLGSYRDAGFGDQTDFDDSDSYLPYIPTSANDGVDFPSYFTYDDFAAILAEVGLTEYAGSFVPKNSHTGAWVNRIDFKFTQELPTFVRGTKVEAYFDMKNVLNFIDHDWGREEGLPFGSNTEVLTDWSSNSAGEIQYRPAFGGVDVTGPRDFRALDSVWRIKMGVKLKF